MSIVRWNDGTYWALKTKTDKGKRVLAKLTTKFKVLLVILTIVIYIYVLVKAWLQVLYIKYSMRHVAEMPIKHEAKPSALLVCLIL